MNDPELLTSAANRPLPLRKRPDLQFQESVFQSQRSWIVKDPLSLNYHRIRDAERSVLEMLDGQT